MKCLKCGAEAAPHLSATWCDSCVRAQKKRQNLGFLFVLLAVAGIPTLILFGLIHACSDPQFSVNDTGVIRGDAVCMGTAAALQTWDDYASKHDDLGERLTFAYSGVTMLYEGDKITITELPSAGSCAYKVKTSSGEQCWVICGIFNKPD
ncbi:MAG TPA: hypothetical protein VKR52_21055 [Terracidiphilus sp.]|nr:hypothetical protein [Terracidiphilus sp.]